MRSPVDCPDIVINPGSNLSNTVLVDAIHADADDIILMASGLDAGKTFTIQINDKRDGSGSWYTLNDGTSDIVPISTQGKASVYPFLNHTFRIVASGIQAGESRWKMKKTYSVGTGIDSD